MCGASTPRKRAPDHPCVEIRGEVDVATAATWQRAGLQLIEEHEVSSVVLDLGAVTFIDSTGLSVLVAIRRAAIASGRDMEVVNVPGHVRRVLDITGLTQVFVNGDRNQSPMTAAGPAMPDSAPGAAPGSHPTDPQAQPRNPPHHEARSQ